MSQEECAILREGVPYVKIYRYNPKHLCPKLNGYGGCITSQYEDSFQYECTVQWWFSASSKLVPDKKGISDATRNTQVRQRIEVRSIEEYKESAGEELTQCDYSKTESVIINCKLLLTIYPIHRDIESKTQ
jgi:hypothetical protein